VQYPIGSKTLMCHVCISPSSIFLKHLVHSLVPPPIVWPAGRLPPEPVFEGSPFLPGAPYF
jgi:hypothetical protein